MEEIKQLKLEYNYNLKRFFNGCKYCEEHKNEIDKWLPEILTILNNIEWILLKIQEYEVVDKSSILGGFKL